jgi:hypothetical protein
MLWHQFGVIHEPSLEFEQERHDVDNEKVQDVELVEEEEQVVNFVD